MTHAVFISYRRDDAEGQSGRLYRDLTEHFGSEAVFMDVDAIEAGTDFRQEIDRQLATCSVLLAVIGKSWLDSTDRSGSRRLDDPTDFVRIETAAALKRGIPVVPVLVQGARMPRVEDLPDGLKELAFRHGIELAHARWNSDVQLLVKALQVYVQPKYPTAASTGSSSTGRIIRSTGGGLLGLLFIGAIWWSLSRPAKLCERLAGQSVYLVGNGYRGVLGPAGISIQKGADESTRFETTIVFDEQATKEFGGKIQDPVTGSCHGDSIQFTRKLRDGSTHLHSGTMAETADKSITLTGTFRGQGGSFDWSGRLADPVR